MTPDSQASGSRQVLIPGDTRRRWSSLEGGDFYSAHAKPEILVYADLALSRKIWPKVLTWESLACAWSCSHGEEEIVSPRSSFPGGGL